MTPREASEDDEMDLINAEFDAMVAGLNLDQSSPRTFLDEIEEIHARQDAAPPLPPRVKQGMHGTLIQLFAAVKKWWNRPNNDESDGATV
jgi:hypothetical protein